MRLVDEVMAFTGTFVFQVTMRTVTGGDHDHRENFTYLSADETLLLKRRDLLPLVITGLCEPLPECVQNSCRALGLFC